MPDMASDLTAPSQADPFVREASTVIGGPASGDASRTRAVTVKLPSGRRNDRSLLPPSQITTAASSSAARRMSA